MSERDANQHLVDTVRMNVEALRHDPLEDTQPLPVAERRERMREGSNLHINRLNAPRERGKP